MQSDRLNQLLSELVVLDIENLIGEGIDVEHVRNIYDQCMSLHQWSGAAAAARLLVRICLCDGLSKLWESGTYLVRQGNRNHAIKNVGAGLYALSHSGRLALLPSLCELDGPPLAECKIGFTEWRYRRKFRKWVADYKRRPKHNDV